MNVTVFFIGVCVHIDNNFPLNTSVVLPNCSQGLTAAGQTIPPHIAKLSIPAAFVVTPVAPNPGLTLVTNDWSWQMNGVQLGLPSGPVGLTKAASYCLPSLTLTAGVQLSLSGAVPNPPACVFGITGGTLDTFLPMNSQAVHGKLTVTLDGTDQADLTVTSQVTTTTITLQTSTTSDPVIFLSNTGGGNDGDADFLLDYLVTTFMPSTVLVPQFANNCGPRQATSDEIAMFALNDGFFAEGLTIGCSNSVYP
jgi:hypothetical protein